MLNRTSGSTNIDAILNNNSTGFSLVAAGSYRLEFQNIEYQGIYGTFWNSTNPGNGIAGYVTFSQDGYVLVHSALLDGFAFPVRCIATIRIESGRNAGFIT